MVPSCVPCFPPQVVVQNRRADSTDDYLNVARECCELLRKTLAPSQSTSRNAPKNSPPDHRAASPVPKGSGVSGSAGGGQESSGDGAASNGSGQGETITEWDLGTGVRAVFFDEKQDAGGFSTRVANPAQESVRRGGLLVVSASGPALCPPWR